MAKHSSGESSLEQSGAGVAPQEMTAGSSWGGPFRKGYRFLGSLKLTVVLMVVAVVVLALATFLDSEKGLDYARWYVYHAWWFIALASLLAANVLVAMLLRFPWKSRHMGFLVAHVGLLVLLAGSIQTFVAGIDGHVYVVEGGPAVEHFTLTDRSQLTAAWREGDTTVAVEFPFNPGPSDWPDGKTLDLGELSDIRVELRGFYRCAVGESGWKEDPDGLSAPTIQFALFGADGKKVGERWLVGHKMISAKMTVGPTRVSLNEVPVSSMLGDLLDPPTDGLGSQGLLSIHYKDQVKQVPVEENVGKTISIGDDGTKVEIAQYLAQPAPGPNGTYISRGDEPSNPALHLRVHLPDAEEPVRQLSLAKTPLMDFSGSRGVACPVKFFYHHPAVATQRGVEFFQTPDGKLSCRVGTDKQYESRGEVDVGSRIKIAGGFQIRLLQHVRHAIQETKFKSVEFDPEQSKPPEAAAHFEVTAAGETQQNWLQRNSRQFGAYSMQTSKGRTLVTLGYARHPLGFSLRLVDFTRGMNPGGMGDASYSSVVEVKDKAGRKQKHKIAMNEPVECGKFTFYQSGSETTHEGREVSRLSVAYDPGRLLKYAGSAMICLGTLIMFYMRGLVSYLYELRRSGREQ